MRMFENQKKINDFDKQYRKSLARSFEEKQDIFAHVKRDQNDIRKKIYKDVQEEIVKQIDEFNDRKSIEKIDRKAGEEL